MAEPIRRLPARPPRWLFHLVLVTLTVVLLSAFSVPGFGLPAFVISIELLVVAAVVWLVRLVAFVRIQRTWSWWFALAPVGGLLVLALVMTDAPFNARWAVSRGAFQATVADLPQAAAVTEWERVDVPARLGAYRIDRAYRVPGGILFYEATGSGSADAGFAYLPAGPAPSLESGAFERPRFEHLGGAWYAWTASW